MCLREVLQDLDHVNNKIAKAKLRLYSLILEKDTIRSNSLTTNEIDLGDLLSKDKDIQNVLELKKQD